MANLRGWPAWLSLSLLTVAVIVAGCNNEWVGSWALKKCPAVTQFCHNAPFLVSIAVLLVLWVLYWVLAQNANPMEVVRGADNRWSTSKLQFFLWTVMVIFSYSSVYAALIGMHALAKLASNSAGS
jgi:hypothetical protein